MIPLGEEGGSQERERERCEIGTPTTLRGGPDGAVVLKIHFLCGCFKVSLYNYTYGFAMFVLFHKYFDLLLPHCQH